MDGIDRILGFDLPFLIQWGIQLLNTLVIILIMSKLLYKPVKSFMQSRTERIKSQMDQAEADFNEAKALRETYEGKLKNIERERSDILTNAKAAATQREQQIIDEAKQEANTIKERAMLEIQREQEKAKDEMKKQIIELSSLMASRFVSAKMDEKTQNALLNEVIADLGAKEWVS